MCNFFIFIACFPCIDYIMADNEARDALSRRLKKTLTETSSPGKSMDSPLRSNLISMPGASRFGPSSPVGGKHPPADVRVEGFLYKYSSGKFSRWQKRFFILEAGKFCYYKKLLNDRDPCQPRKAFSVRRVRSVLPKDPKSVGEFDLIFTNGNTYQMKAPTSEDMRKWVSSFQAAIVYCQANPDFNPRDDGHSDFGDASVGSGAVSESSPSSFVQNLHAFSSSRRDSTVSSVTATSPHHHAPTLLELDTDSVDKNFEEWFYFLPPPTEKSQVLVHREIRITHVVDACNRASSSLWSLLGPRVSPNSAQIVDEYMIRLFKFVGKCLDARSAFAHSGSSSELVALMDCIVRINVALDKFFTVDVLPLGRPPTAPVLTKCVCCYCDPSGVGLLKRKSPTPSCPCSTSDKWRKSLRSILQRLGSELEVGLIEEVQVIIGMCEVAWTSPPCATSSSGDTVYGPCVQTHPLLEDSGHVLLTSFTPTFLQTVQTKCLNASLQAMAAYPLAARLVAEHVASATIACVNSVSRQFKRNAAAEYTKHSTRRGSTASNSSGTDESVSLENLVAFANECVLMSVFCSSTWRKNSAKFVPEIFQTCMEGLSSAFLQTSCDVCHSIVQIHLSPCVKYDMYKCWSPKILSIAKTSPMNVCKTFVDVWIGDLKKMSALECVVDACKSLSAEVAVRGYVCGLVRQKPRMKTFKTIPELLTKDIDIFQEFFGSSRILVELGKVVCERNRINFSVSFNAIARILGSAAHAHTILTAVTKMREHEFASSADKKDVASMLSAMKQSVIEFEPTPETGDTSTAPKNGIIKLQVGKLKTPWSFDD